MKNYSRTLVVVLAIVAVIAIVQNVIVRNAIVVVTQNLTGVPASIGGCSINLLKQKLSIRNFVLYHPAGFPEGAMITIPEITVELDAPALLQGKIRAPQIVFHLKELVVTKRSDGRLSVDSLKFMDKTQAPKPAQPTGRKDNSMPLQIDNLTLSIGQVVYKDYTKGTHPYTEVYDVGIRNKTFQNITSPEQLATVVLVQAMGPTAIKSAVLYGVATVLGVGFLPVGVAGILTSNDKAIAEFESPLEKVYEAALVVLKKTAEGIVEDRTGKILRGSAKGVMLVVKIESATGNKVKVTVSARKMLLAKPEAARGFLYQLREKIN